MVLDIGFPLSVFLLLGKKAVSIPVFSGSPGEVSNPGKVNSVQVHV